MEQNSANLFRQLDSLTEVFSRLGVQLSQATRELQSNIPPSKQLLEELDTSRKQFEELCAQGLELAKSLAVTLTPRLEQMVSLGDLEILLGAVVEAEKKKAEEEEVRQHALTVLNQVLAIAHRDNIDFPPLLESQTTARQLSLAVSDSHLPDLHPDTQALALGNHRFSKLLTLISEWDDPDDERLADLQDVVAQSFGRTLAMAAVRGRLIIRADSSPPQVPASAIGSAEVASRISHLEPETAPTKQPPAEIDSQASPDEIAPEDEAAPTALQEETTEESAVALVDSAIAPPTTEITQEETPVKILTIPAQTETIAETVILALSPNVETQHEESAKEQIEEEGKETQSLYQFSPNDTAQQIATSILSNTGFDRTAVLHSLKWQLLREDKLGLAFHLTRCLEIQLPNIQPHLPSWLIRVVALGRHVRYEVGAGEIANLLMDDFANFGDSCFVDGESEWNQAVSLLLAASALRPALLAPNTNASDILHYLRLGEGLNQLFEYCQTIANYGSQRYALNTTAIKKVRSQGVWEADVAALLQQVEVWWSQAPLLNMIYGPAKTVWSEWLKPNELIHTLLLPVKQNDLSRLEVVKQSIEQLSYEAQINTEVKRTQREIGRSRGGNAITGMALGRIRLHVREAVDFGRRWIELQESHPDKSNNYSQSQAQQLKQDLSSLHKTVLDELDSFKQKKSSVLVLAGISCCRIAVENIRTLFDPDVRLSTEEADSKHLLHADMLKISAPMDANWEPEVGNPDLIVSGILNLLANNCFDWQQAFEVRSRSRDHEATERIIDYLRANSDKSINLEELEKKRDEGIGECQDSLERDIKDTRSKIEGAVALGILQEADRANYAAMIVEIEKALKTTVLFSKDHEELGAIRSRIDEKKQAAIENIKQRLNVLSLASEHPDYVRISHLVEQGDVLTANEYIDMVQRGDAIPERKAEKDSFRDFFPKKALDIDQFMEAKHPTVVIGKVKNRESFCDIDLKRVTGAQTDRAAEMLTAWFGTKNSGKNRQMIDKESARTLLTNLGFNPLEIAVNNSGGRLWINVSTEVIRDKKSCPVAGYGSEANGQYRILCVWDRPTAEDIINAVGETSHGSPALVFFFGRLTEQRRRELARTCRERRRTFVLIDDILMLYLCGEPGLRLPILFNCALPFTFLEPYAYTAGLVRPEIFYGRKLERDSIIKADGSCFIYGGRQLGKTALLRSVEREFHALQEGRIAYWLDLKACGLGVNRPIEDIWSLLADVFKSLEVVPRSMPPNAGVDTLLQHTKNWLEQNKSRRILLLLDEADKFLEFDGMESYENDKGQGEFIQTSRLKGLMDQTERRFKVVFAGLHNVQRTTRLENHPLAHYGEPLCIGPLLDNGEWREARDLIKHPLASIGYELSDDLVTRILSQTNYYPSLIQLYCQELLRDVNKNHLRKFDSRNTPPYQITAQQVEEAYKSQNLRKAIRDRFRWTLQLDQRYEVIAYSIAYDSLKSQKGMVDGFSVSWVQDAVLTWWSDGFRDKSTDEIRALLEEMVGLGVLRRVDSNGCFALRSPNVILLMGTEEEIEEQLLRSREAPPEYDPETFRSALRNDPTQRSPLTVQQESKLRSRENGVSIIFGCSVAGLDELRDFLVSAVGQEFFIPLDSVLNQADFTKRLGDLNKREREVDGTTIVLVSPTCPWTQHWLETALKKIHNLKSKKSFARVVFIANPQMAWDLVSQNATGVDSLVSKEVTIFSLKPWHDAALRQWLEDCDFTAKDQEIRKIVTEVTGNWPTLLQNLYKRSKADHNWEHNLQELKKSLTHSDVIRELADSMGFDCSYPQRRLILRDLATLEEASAEELIGIVEGTSAEIVNQTLRWAEMLRLAFPVGSDKWRVDPLVGRILASLEE